jgi:hypothetical protein
MLPLCTEKAKFTVCAPFPAMGLDEVVVDGGFLALASFSVSQPRGVYCFPGRLWPFDGCLECVCVGFVSLHVLTVGICSGESK